MLTQSQKNLLIEAEKYTSEKCAIKYDILKDMLIGAGFKSFDLTFNALFNKGYFERVETNDFSNQFKRTAKKY